MCVRCANLYFNNYYHHYQQFKAVGEAKMKSSTEVRLKDFTFEVIQLQLRNLLVAS